MFIMHTYFASNCIGYEESFFMLAKIKTILLIVKNVCITFNFILKYLTLEQIMYTMSECPSRSNNIIKTISLRRVLRAQFSLWFAIADIRLIMHIHIRWLRMHKIVERRQTALAALSTGVRASPIYIIYSLCIYICICMYLYCYLPEMT